MYRVSMKCSTASVSQQCVLCSEWVPSEWESDKNITIIHTTPVHQLTSGEDKSWNKSSIKTFWTQIRVIIHNNASSSEKSVLVWIRREICTDAKTAQNKHVSGFWCERWQKMLFFTGGSVIMYYGFHKMLIYVVDYCDVFIRLSFWRHPFTAEHPLLRHWCRDTFLQIWWRNKPFFLRYDLRSPVHLRVKSLKESLVSLRTENY